MTHACSKCRSMFPPTPSQIRSSIWICRPCRLKDDAVYRVKRRAAGLPTCGGPTTYNPVKAKDYRSRPDVKAREATRQREISHEPDVRKKNKARLQARKAITAGLIQRLPCRDCGHEKSEAHHPNYDKPLDVVFLCVKHHRAEHKRDAGRGHLLP